MTFLRRFFRRRPAPTAMFSPVGALDGARWLQCDTTVCAHLTTRHTPTNTGWTCTRCHTTKGDQ